MSSKFRRTIVRASVVVGALIATISITGAAHARGEIDPNWNNCSSRGVNLNTPQMPNGYLKMVDPANGSIIGYAYLRYSVNCKTQRVKVNYNGGYYPKPWVWKQNQSGTDLTTSYFAPWQGTVWTWALTNMQYTGAAEAYISIAAVRAAATWDGSISGVGSDTDRRGNDCARHCE